MLTTHTYLFSQEISDWQRNPREKSLCLLKDESWELILVKFKGEELDFVDPPANGILVSIDKESRTFLQLVSHGKQIKGNGYACTLSLGDEIQLPIAGDDHLVFMISGDVDCVERSNDRLFHLGEGDALRITRSNKKKEYLNLRLKGKTKKSVLVWLVIHYLSHH